MGIIGFYHNHKLYTYRKNLFGDITEIYDGNTCVAKYVYDAWGNHKVCNPDGTENFSELFIGNINPIRYRGYYYDVETGLYYLKSRYYDPSIGRFISPDGVEYLEPDNLNGLNLYAYCGNNPIMYVDPSGHFLDYIFDAVFIAWSIHDLRNGGYKDWKNWVALGIDLVFAALPFVPSGASQLIRVGNKIDDALDVASAINKIDNIHDMSKVTIIGRDMERVREAAIAIGKADDIYDMWHGFDAIKEFNKPLGYALSGLENASWLFGKLRNGYTVIDIGITTTHKGKGWYYGIERFIVGQWKYRNIWKLPVNIWL